MLMQKKKEEHINLVLPTTITTAQRKKTKRVVYESCACFKIKYLGIVRDFSRYFAKIRPREKTRMNKI